MWGFPRGHCSCRCQLGHAGHVRGTLRNRLGTQGIKECWHDRYWANSTQQRDERVSNKKTIALACTALASRFRLVLVFSSHQVILSIARLLLSY